MSSPNGLPAVHAANPEVVSPSSFSLWERFGERVSVRRLNGQPTPLATSCNHPMI